MVTSTLSSIITMAEKITEIVIPRKIVQNASVMAIIPDPVPKSMSFASGLDSSSCRQTSINVSVSGRGINTLGLTMKSRDQKDVNDPHLSKGDVRFEPNSALIAEQQGLQDILDISQQSHQHLSHGGYLIFEHGYNQKQMIDSKQLFIIVAHLCHNLNLLLGI
jgi:hypothetical protein